MSHVRRARIAALLFGAVSAIVWIGATRNRTQADDSPPAGRKLALLVGVCQYRHSDLPNLEYPENDVEDLADVLKQQGFSVTLLTTRAGRADKERAPDAANIRRQLSALLKDASKSDLIVVGLAGHGLQPLFAPQSYFCPSDANPAEHDGKLARPETLLSIGEILGQLRDSGIGEKLLLVDACRNDPQVRGRRGVTQVDVSSLPPQTGVLLSCAPGEFSFEHKSLGKGHGVFFYHVIEGLKGAAKDADDSDISWDGLRTYVKKKVPATVKSLYGKEGGEQRPNDIGNLIGEPTVLAIARVGARSIPDKPTQEPVDRFAGTHTGQTRELNDLKIRLTWIPAGEFTMGSRSEENDRNDDEDPVDVTLARGFWLGIHEVTQSQWQRVMHNTPWSGKTDVKEGDGYPATYVSWQDALEFCRKLTEEEHKAGRLPTTWKYTLPTEAQWEYACRAGTTSRFGFGDGDSDLSESAWFAKNAHDADEKYGHPVGQKKPNRWGLHDMHGNVCEWCRDVYAKVPSKLAEGNGLPEAPPGSNHVIRGGSWGAIAGACRSAAREFERDFAKWGTVGFRLACRRLPPGLH